MEPDILKSAILDCIATSRALLRELVQLARDYPHNASHYYAMARHEQAAIKREIGNLTELKRIRTRQLANYTERIANGRR